MDIRAYNRNAWNKAVATGDRWTIPVTESEIAAARSGQWQIVLTPTKPVPPTWFPDLAGLDILCLASGGGQQGPILAAAGATVTVFDNSPSQLEQDRFVANRNNISITTIEGDMADLSIFPDQAFDLIVHPVSNVFVPNVHPVWMESFRVLRRGGALLAGFANPMIFLFDVDLSKDKGILQVKYPLPYSDLADLTDEERQFHVESGYPLTFSHTLEDQISGQLEAGFLINGFFEDTYAKEDNDQLSDYSSCFIATRAVKP